MLLDVVFNGEGGCVTLWSVLIWESVGGCTSGGVGVVTSGEEDALLTEWFSVGAISCLAP